MTTALIKDLEKAERGSRRLGKEVLIACGWTITDRYCRDHDGKLRRPHDWVTPEGKIVEYGKEPDPTQSIDDALSLLPEGWDLYCVTGRGVRLRFRPNPEIGEAVGEHRSNIKLAICIALLRAKEAGND